jgi:hypothetical protein
MTAVIVCGDRNWTDRAYLFSALNAIDPSIVIHGACRGADLMACDWAAAHERECHAFPAQWKHLGKAAGPRRNAEMLDYLIRTSRKHDPQLPAMVIAFHPDIDKSKGTKDMVEQARLAGVPVEDAMSTQLTLLPTTLPASLNEVKIPPDHPLTRSFTNWPPALLSWTAKTTASCGCSISTSA